MKQVGRNTKVSFAIQEIPPFCFRGISTSHQEQFLYPELDKHTLSFLSSSQEGCKLALSARYDSR